MLFLGLRTVIYPAVDLHADKAWWERLLAKAPYFDQPFYVGFDVAGYELGLDPNADVARGAVTYWGVRDAAEGLRELLDAGAEPDAGVTEVGEGIKVATVRLGGSRAVVGVIENPHSSLGEAGPGGAGR